jgi:hypothetical protein
MERDSGKLYVAAGYQEVAATAFHLRLTFRIKLVSCYHFPFQLYRQLTYSEI